MLETDKSLHLFIYYMLRLACYILRLLCKSVSEDFDKTAGRVCDRSKDAAHDHSGEQRRQ